ncbi:RimK family alpha-L-glutamate ligase [Paenalkalicoccus suaedae]|uniref:RimK family alpha-L-glutamate ligase n=1 Tax=Paenalkalicoccus suaedae TaxID=2592382 RepID=A0A859FET9_9BACI|nr:RimK family alpha-L-glutamate ligase [Paenalkalicoccus suaedae]QKS71863.1 RimK family alpha-L-glutamate ligase [Paenalkalicoccus suaedae]
MQTLHGLLIYNGGLRTEKFISNEDRFVRAATSRGIHLTKVANDDLLVMTAGPTHIAASTPFTHPDFIFFADKDISLAQALESQGIPVYNSAHSIATCDNKNTMHQVLHKHQIPTPTTILAPKRYHHTTPTYLHTIVKTIGLPLIVKEAYGSFGQQVYFVETLEELERIAEKLSSVEHLYQEAIVESLGNDLRLNVVGDRVVASMKRHSTTDFRANITAGGSAEVYSPTQAEQDLAIAAAKACGTDFAGVDLLQTNNGPVICEVNSNPHLQSIFDCTGVEVEYDMIDHIIQTRERRTNA